METSNPGTEEKIQYVASGYDGKYITGILLVDTSEEAQNIVEENDWEEEDSDIVIKKCVVRDGKIVSECIEEVLKGTAQPFMKGINTRNKQRESSV